MLIYELLKDGYFLRPNPQNSRSTGILCAICGRDHGVSPNNKHLYNGFKDGDTGETIGWSCRDAHYDRKVNSVHGGKYTEMPVVL